MSESNINREAEAALNHDDLVTALRYNKKTGVFRWKVKMSATATEGKVAGSVHSKLKYITITMWGCRYQAHRLAWFYIYKEWPKGVIDHKDRNPSNNAINNLQDVTQSKNMHNAKIRTDNWTGVAGVSYMENRQCWRARINLQGKETHLGVFRTKEQAIRARLEAEERNK